MPSTPSISELKDVFTPFMLGTISLILFLSGRNMFLATRIRELSKELKRKSPDSRGYLIMQICYFAHRYRISNTALIFAITSVFSFGAMIGVVVFTVIEQHFATGRTPWNSTANIFSELPLLMCVIGGVTATAATIMSIKETYMARKSLFTHVAACIVLAKLTRSDCSEKDYLGMIEKLVRKRIDQDLHGRLIDVQRRVVESPPMNGA